MARTTRLVVDQHKAGTMTYEVKKHLLYLDGQLVPQRPSANHGGVIVPSVLVLHYTATRTAESAIRTLTDAKSSNRVSCHLVLDRDGKVTQLLPLNVAGWHVGKSVYGKKSGVNSFSLGIEMVNAGIVNKRGDGTFVDWTGTPLLETGVIEANHRITHGHGFWQTYPKAQVEAAASIGAALRAAYNLKDVVGHEDVATPKGRKTDPGPAFPIEIVEARIMGRG